MNNQSHPVGSDDLNAYVDGVLSNDERAWLDAQAGLDPAIHQELLELGATARLLGTLPTLKPRRSFALGAEYARPTPIAATANGNGILQFLPIVRTLSVAAIMVFMVVAGSLFFDINGNSTGNTSQEFAQQNEILSSVTESNGDASHNAEDANEPPAPAAAQENESSMTSRGDAASASDDPMEDLTQLESAAGADEEASTSTTAQDAADVDEDRSSWVITSTVIGGLALALAGIWFVLARMGRETFSSRS